MRLRFAVIAAALVLIVVAVLAEGDDGDSGPAPSALEQRVGKLATCPGEEPPTVTCEDAGKGHVVCNYFNDSSSGTTTVDNGHPEVSTIC